MFIAHLIFWGDLGLSQQDNLDWLGLDFGEPGCKSQELLLELKIPWAPEYLILNKKNFEGARMKNLNFGT